MSKNTCIAVDWGTSNFRAYLLDEDGSVHQSVTKDQGMKSLNPQTFEPFLLQAIAPWCREQPYPVILCGMVGAKTGWMETPYIPIQKIMEDLPKNLTKVKTQVHNLEAYIVSGACQKQPHYDVMRGEETQIYGFLQQIPEYSGHIILPGTHSKWVRVEQGQCLDFQTFMTGELYAWLSKQSILSSVIAQNQELNADVFNRGLHEGQQSSIPLSAQLFNIRAMAMLDQEKEHYHASYLSGLLIGQEFSVQKPERVTIIGATSLGKYYSQACDYFDIPYQIVSAAQVTVRGLHTCINYLKQGQ